MKYKGLIAGLGNPGPKYARTRHNCGFECVDRLLALAEEEGRVEELNGKKFLSRLWQVTLPQLEGTWLVAKPQTFMNESGKAIRPLLSFHNLSPAQLIVIQDELDLPPGSLRFKEGGGLAGHNGLSSIAQETGSRDFYRLRIGIGKPEEKDGMIDWVLGKPSPAEQALIAEAIPRAIETIFVFVADGVQAAMQFARSGVRQ